MKTRLCWILLISCGTVLANLSAQRGGIIAMTDALKTNDLAQFMRATASHDWRAPLIWSRWHVDKYCTNAKRDVELLRREFGRVVALKLDEEAGQLTNATASAVRHARASTLLDLAAWLGQSFGYGNALLAMRANDIAAVHLGYMTADLSFPLGAVSNQLARMNLFWNDVDSRTQLLNQDAGMRLFQPKGRTPEDRARELHRMWDCGATPDGLDALCRSGRLPARFNTREIRNHPELFFKMPKDGPYSISYYWDKPLYLIIAHEFDVRNVEKVKSLLMFRAVIGHFPTNYLPEWRMSGMTENQAAFGYAWNMHVRKTREYKKQNDDAAGAQAYDAILSHSFVDEESHNTQQRRMSMVGRAPEWDHEWLYNLHGAYGIRFAFAAGATPTTMRCVADKCRNDGYDAVYPGRTLDGDRQAPSNDDREWSF